MAGCQRSDWKMERTDMDGNRWTPDTRGGTMTMRCFWSNAANRMEGTSHKEKSVYHPTRK